MWSQQNSALASAGFFPSWLRATLGPLLLMAVTLPLATLLLSASAPPHDGSLQSLLQAVAAAPLATLRASFLAPTATTLTVLLIFVAWQLALMRLVPGPAYEGPPTATGHVPRYTANGVASFCLTLLAYVGLSTWGLGAALPPALHYSPAILYAEYARLISLLSLGALGICVALMVKGRTCPSGRDAGSSGNMVLDLYWGTELYPRVLGFDVKQFTNCRFGMMLWGLLPLAFAAHGWEASGTPLPSRAVLVNTALQLVYVFKFFLWESGYMRSLDIMHDRAGYMICWGCMVWVPSVYVSHSYFLAVRAAKVGPAEDLSLPVAAGLLVAGLACVYINYEADAQRAHVRADPKALVWGQKPRVIRAKYSSGKATKTSILLASGWWGLARHFHYVPEILASVAWSAPAALCGGGHALIPWFYCAFLTILLLDRAFRDDARCADKYGRSWEEYKKLVPYKIIPGVL